MHESMVMKCRIDELIDIPQLQKLMESLYQATGLANAFIDVGSKVLTAAGWQRICTDFHRVHPTTCTRCLESDQYILSHLKDGPYVGYYCQNGLVDYCTPVVIEGEHLANLFTGQMFHEPPDVEFFRKQAAEFGFDEASYLAALGEVPIIPKERMPGIMAFLQNLAHMLAASGMERQRVLESEKRLQDMNEELERRVAERTRELENSATSLQRAQQVAHTGSWTLDIVNNRLTWSEETYHLFGIPPGTPLTLEDFLARIHPDDRQAFAAAWQDVLDGKIYDLEHRILVAREVKWVHEQAELEFDSNGKACFAIGTVKDITEHKLLELQTEKSLSLLQATLDATADGILVADGAGHVVAYNQRFGELWRIPPELLAIRDDNALLSYVLNQLEEPENFLVKVKQLYAMPDSNSSDIIYFKDGRIFERHSNPQRIEGKTVGRVWSFRDVTERHHMAAKLLEMNRTLEQRVTDEVARNMEQERLLIQQSRLAAMGEMIGNIAHQWRQPINALALLLANIKDAYEFHELDGNFLDDAVKTGNRLIHSMSTTIDDFRNFFRPDKEKHLFKVSDGIDAAIKMVSAAFKNADIDIDFEHGHTPCVVFGYPNEFEQVALNILTNAKDAILTAKVRGQVRIRSERKEDTVTVVLHDNGGGIPDAILDKVFDPYFTTKEKGTGIGLYMSKTIMRNMGGDITIRNAGSGTEVRIVLPLASNDVIEEPLS